MQATQGKQERNQKTHFLGSGQSLGAVFVQHLAQQGPFLYVRLLDAHFKVSIFEIWLPRALSIPSHICCWEFGLQDWRWSSSLCCRKWCHTVKRAMLNSCRTQRNFSSAAEFHWAGIQDESPGLGQASQVSVSSSLKCEWHWYLWVKNSIYFLIFWLFSLWTSLLQNLRCWHCLHSPYN